MALWEARANLIRKLGYEAGNLLMLQITTDGMKLSPPNPNFLQARDGVLQAERARTGGVHQSDLWEAFAKRGMGFSATSPSSSTTEGVEEAFDVPDDLRLTPNVSFTSLGPEAGPFSPPSELYTLANGGTNQVVWAARKSAGWFDLSAASGVIPVGGDPVSVALTLKDTANDLPVGNYSDTVTFTNSVTGRSQSRRVLLRVSQRDYFTQHFADQDNDLSFQSFTFTPDGSPSFYSVCREEVREFPTDPSAATVLTLDDLEGGKLSLSDGARVLLYGAHYDGFYVSEGGYLTFTQPASDFFASLAAHFSLPRVSMLFDLLDASEEGVISWIQLPDRVAVTFENVPTFFEITRNSFQVELFFDGRIRLSYLEVGTTGGLVGLSEGKGEAEDFLESRFRGYGACLPTLAVSLPPAVSEADGNVVGLVSIVEPLPRDLAVTLVSLNASRATVESPVILARGETSVSFSVRVADNPDLDGTKVVGIVASSDGFREGRRRLLIEDNEMGILTVQVPPEVTEGDGSLGGRGTVSVSAPTAKGVVVRLSSSDPAELGVPAIVVIPAGETSAAFDIHVMDDSEIDGASVQRITASVARWTDGSAGITVRDNERRDLALKARAVFGENTGLVSAAATIGLGGSFPVDLTVTLTTSDPTSLKPPATVLIPQGQTNATFDLTAVDNATADGARPVTLTAQAEGFREGVFVTMVNDDETPPQPVSPHPQHLSSDNSPTTSLSWSGGEGEALVNGGFERGDLSGWILESGGEGRFLINDGTLDPEGPEPPTPPGSGKYDALSQQHGPGRYALIQDLTLAPGATSATLEWSDRIHNHASFYLDPDQRFQVEIRSPDDQVLAVAYATLEGDPLLQDWVRRRYDLSDFIGRAIRIAFVSEARYSYLNVHLDDVSVRLGEPGKTMYEVYFGTNAIPGASDLLGVTTSNRWDLPRLSIAQTYRWQVVAKHEFARSAGPIWEFSVAGVGPLHHFSWDAVPSLQSLGVPFPVRLAAKDVFSNTITNYVGEVGLSARLDLPDVVVGDGTNKWEFPLGAFLPDARSQVLYLAEEVGSARRITAVALRVLELGDSALNNFTIRMKHSPLRQYPEAPSWERLGWTTVYQRKETFESIGWVEFSLSTPFDYDGTNSLMVDFSYSGSGFGVEGEVESSSVSAERALVFSSFGFYGNPLTWSGKSSPTPEGFAKVPNLRFSGVNEFAVVPALAGTFTQGVWSGQVSISQLVNGLVLKADDGEGHLGLGPVLNMRAVDDLSLVGVASPDPVTVGSSVTNLLQVGNSGPTPSTGVVVTSKFSPAGDPLVTLVSQGSYTITNNTLVWKVGTLPGLRSARIQFVQQPSAPPRPTIHDVTVSRFEPESYLANNSLRLATSVLPVPTVSIEDIERIEGDSGRSQLLFPVSLSVASSREVVVDYSTSAGSAQKDVDFSSVSGQLVFAPGVTRGNVVIDLVGDLLDEAEENLFVNLSAPRNATLLRSRGTATIHDDDGPQVTIDDLTVAEKDKGISDATFTVRLAQTSPQVVSVGFSTATASAAAGVDFVANTGTLRIAPGSTTGLVKVQILGDVSIEPNERFFVNLFNPTNATLADRQAIGTILNDDGLPGRLDHFEWDAVPSPQLVDQPFVATLRARDAFGHPATNFAGRANLSGEILRPELAIGTGDVGWDEPLSTFYEDSRTQLIYLASELSGARRITGLALNFLTLPGLPLQQWTIRLKHTSGASYTAASIWDNSGWTVVYQDHERINQRGWVWFDFSVPFDFDGVRNLVIDLSFNNSDYDFSGGECASTETPLARALWGASDSLYGDPLSWGGLAGDPVPRKMVLNLQLRSRNPVSMSPTNSGLFADGVWSGTVTVHDLANGMNLRADDLQGHVGVSQTFDLRVVDDLSVAGAAAPELVTAGQPFSYSFTLLNSGPAASTGVLLSNVVPAGVQVLEAVASQGTCRVSNGITVCDLGTLPGGSNATVTLSCLSPTRAGLITSRTEVLRIEKDPYLTNNVVNTRVQVNGVPLVSARDIALVEGSSGPTNASVQVVLSVVSSQIVTVDYIVTNSAARAGSDFLPAAGTLTFPPGVTNQSISVVVIGDTLDESDEGFVVQLSNAVHGTLARAIAVVTIEDDDGPLVLMSSVAVDEGDQGIKLASFQFRLSAPSPQTVFFQYATADDTAIAPVDYSSVSGLVRFLAGSLTQNVQIVIKGDISREPDESFFLNLFNPVDLTLATSRLMGTILNEDGVPGKVDHFEWQVEPNGLRATRPWGASVRAVDGSNQLVRTFVGAVALRGEVTNPEVTIGTGAEVSSNPLDTSWEVSRVQTIYRAAEIGSARTLTALALNLLEAPGRTLEHWTIRVKHTSLSSYSQASPWEGGGWITVYQSDEAIGQTGWVVFPFSRPFDFNGVNNLAVDFSFRNSNSDFQGAKCLSTLADATRTLALTTFDFAGDPLSWTGLSPTPDLLRERPDIRLSSFQQIPIQPGQSDAFVDGRWAGSLMVSQSLTNLTVRATDDVGHTGATALITVFPWLDTDADGIPDDWEQTYGLDVSNGADAAADFDGDGATNGEEFLAGTNPKSFSQSLRLHLAIGTEEAGVLSFESVSGKLYLLESSADLERATWETVQDGIYGTGLRLEVPLSNVVNRAARFFRLRLKASQ